MAEHTHEGTSTAGNFQEALDRAIHAAHERANTGGADIQVHWRLDEVTGVSGGITGDRSIKVKIRTT
ncbi:hypothetical protein HNQ07_002015 [Deinococcus metalli]|uniref:Dodecin domain-containing protein n=1 Tax=Deinococcus metalli TaxID=1141878 RepID=A0A7W8NP89_9DEIO|nr:hypothetical protein [Deinococcus metalli]MBB5376551.1 hypothetical protein [Deinococcus metalli]GHF43177.1 hypothetical protein GCM10017781_19500 [Deinococcus metalli]